MEYRCELWTFPIRNVDPNHTDTDINTSSKNSSILIITGCNNALKYIVHFYNMGHLGDGKEVVRFRDQVRRAPV